jgi:hypothetical protein
MGFKAAGAELPTAAVFGGSEPCDTLPGRVPVRAGTGRYGNDTHT